MKCLPEVRDSRAVLVVTDEDVFGEALPIRVAVTKQAALVGQACFSEGDVKSTYGTGGYPRTQHGRQLVRSRNRLLSTVAYRPHGETTYALEGSSCGGLAIQWLRDGWGSLPRGRSRAAGAIGSRFGALTCARLHRARGALLGSRRARRDRGPHQGLEPCRDSTRRATVSSNQTRDLLMQWRRWDRPAQLKVDAAWHRTDLSGSGSQDVLDVPISAAEDG